MHGGVLYSVIKCLSFTVCYICKKYSYFMLEEVVSKTAVCSVALNYLHLHFIYCHILSGIYFSIYRQMRSQSFRNLFFSVSSCVCLIELYFNITSNKSNPLKKSLLCQCQCEQEIMQKLTTVMISEARPFFVVVELHNTEIEDCF